MMKYGQLLDPQIKMHRQYFREMCKLLGIYVLYRPIIECDTKNKYTTYAEIDVNYKEPMLIGCIFDEHPTQKTLRKMGWSSELQDNSSFIHVDYDLPELQVGCLFIIPSALDNAVGRIFRVVSMETGMIYPASVTCEIVPEYINEFDTVFDYDGSDTCVLGEEELGPTSALTENELDLLGE